MIEGAPMTSGKMFSAPIMMVVAHDVYFIHILTLNKI